MENIILNIWIDMKNGLKVRLLEKPGPEDTSLLIMEDLKMLMLLLF